MINIKHRWHRQHRYYEALVTQDLLGDWVVMSCWGDQDKNGTVRRRVVASEEQAMDWLYTVYRRKKRQGFTGVG